MNSKQQRTYHRMLKAKLAKMITVFECASQDSKEAVTYDDLNKIVAGLKEILNDD